MAKHPARSRPERRPARRAFAMPVVIVLAFVASIMGAVLLERESAMLRLAEREVKAYRDRHYERGVREVIGAWADTLASQPLEKLTESDGHILNLELPDGGGAAVYMFDGQGSLLTDPTGLSSRERQDWQGIVAEFGALGAQGDSSWYRPVGPLAVCVASAPSPLLRAIGRYVGGANAGLRFMEEIERARSRGDELTPADLQTAFNAADFTPAQRETMTRLVVLKPDLRAVVVDVYEATPAGGRQAELVRRYGGRLILPGASGRFAGSMTSMGKFLSWEELPLTEGK